MAMPMNTQTQSADFVIAREFDAPRDMVWKAFTEPERMKQWWGPKGFTIVAAKMNLRPGGTYHYGMGQGWSGTLDQLTAYLANTE
jgi:uncharacterized protein YndB with AHSA1/START domain